MRLAALWMVVVSIASAQQFISWHNQEGRLVDKLVPVTSSECPDWNVYAPVTIDKQGNVTAVKKNKLIKIPDALWSQVVSLVSRLHYRPYVDKGKTKPIKTVVKVPCFKQ